MRRDRFLDAFARYLPYLRELALQQSGLHYDDANEAIGRCIKRLLVTKKYVEIEPSKLKAFLYATLRFDIKSYLRSEAKKKLDCARLPDPEQDFTADSKVKVNHAVLCEAIDKMDCPFCYLAWLNKYGACALCHTILPRNKQLQKEVIVMTEESLAVTFDFNTKIDVQNAIAKLTPYEQRLVLAIGMGNESLESFAELSDRHFTTIGRDWVRVKAKLQELLSDYAPGKLSKRGNSAFRKAVQSIEKTKENVPC